MSKYKIGPDVDLDKEIVLDRKGRRITEKRAQRMARDTLRRVGRGRPSLTGAGHHSPQVSIRVSEDLHRAVTDNSAQQHKSISETGREALEQYVEHQSRGREPHFLYQWNESLVGMNLGVDWLVGLQNSISLSDSIRKSLVATGQIGRLANDLSLTTNLLSESLLAQTNIAENLQAILAKSLLNQAAQAVALSVTAQVTFPEKLVKLLSAQTEEMIRAAVVAQGLSEGALLRTATEMVERLQGTSNWPAFELIQKQVAPFVEKFGATDEEELAHLVQENLIATSEDAKSEPPRSKRSVRRGRTLTKQQATMVAWLIIMVMALPSFREYNLDKAVDTSNALAVNMASALILWHLLEGRRDS